GVGSKTWYWPGDGVVVPGTGDGSVRLVLFLHQMGSTPSQQGVWSFKAIGGAVAVVDNYRDDPDRWRVVQFRNPHAVGKDAAEKAPGRFEVSWGVAVYLDPDYGSASDRFLYIYGVQETSKWNKQLMLARVAPRAVCRFDTWRFYAGSGQWVTDPSKTVPVAEHVVNELSVERIVVGGKPRLVMVHSEPVFGTRIMIRLANRPEGPWSKPQYVYDVPGVKKNKAYFTYAAKGHAHLSRSGELLVSYVINSNDFRAMVSDADIYRPRFIRAGLDGLTDNVAPE
ncbi:MAG: DUF4185 domain-containing protein, partial [Phycisphaerae bacterium]|nr:DUF4185 domain-containing protein [Phycisphaerae bacterium]